MIGVGLSLPAISVRQRRGFLLDFAGGQLPSGMTFQRGSTATYFDAAGALRTSGPDEPRFDCDPLSGAFHGLFIEAEGANLVPASSDLANGWGLTANVVLSDNTGAAPDGTLTADKIAPAAGVSSFGSGNPSKAIPASQGQVVTYSRLVKAAGAPVLRIDLRKNNLSGHIAGVAINVLTNAVSIQSQTGDMSVLGTHAQQLRDGWWRVGLTAVSAGSDTTNLTIREFCMGANNAAFTGNGVDGLLFWGADGKASASLSSYVPTATAAVTRSADQASFALPAGAHALTYTFDDGSTHVVPSASGTVTVPTNLPRRHILRIEAKPAT